jgi:hypothetical protein
VRTHGAVRTRFASGFGVRVLIGLLLLAAGAARAEGWRLGDLTGLPEWLTLAGESRARYETLDGQFRANGSGGDQLLSLRTLLYAEAESGPLAFGLELQDARTYLDDAGTPLSNGTVNPLDVLQAWARLRYRSPVAPAAATEVWLGRQTFTIGSGRQVERYDYANVIVSYTGLRLRTVTDAGHELHAFYTAPVGREPVDRADLDDNRLERDREQWGRRFWGLHYRHAELFGAALPRLWTEAFVYGLVEEDRGSVATPERRYATPGLRIYRVPDPGAWDLDLEAAWRFGSRRATLLPEDRDDLDVRAGMLFAALGYTFAHRWRPRLAVEYYHASGDADPQDDRFDQYEFLFGARRADLGTTGLFGPLMPANLEAAGLRFEFRPDARLDGRLNWKAAWLAESRDAWVAAGLRDPTGRSGDFIGHMVDGRVRRWLVPNALRVELGGSVLLKGRFARQAPLAPPDDDTAFGYLQMTVYF